MSRYWGLRNSVEPFHRVTHRAIGDIPGCTLAPRSGTFVGISREKAAALTLARADEYASHLAKYVSGEYGGNSGLDDMWSAVSQMKPLRGAFGEKL